MRNVGTCRPDGKEKRKWRPHERESTKAGHRGGVARSSEKGAVMVRERRGDIAQLDCEVNQRWAEPGGSSKAIDMAKRQVWEA